MGEKKLEDMTIKEALSEDIANALLRGRIIIDPAPTPFIPITPFVIGKKAIKGIKQIFYK